MEVILGPMLALVVIKTLDMIRYVCIKTYLYILPEISGHHLQLECIVGHLFSVPSLHKVRYYMYWSNFIQSVQYFHTSGPTLDLHILCVGITNNSLPFLVYVILFEPLNKLLNSYKYMKFINMYPKICQFYYVTGYL